MAMSEREFEDKHGVTASFAHDIIEGMEAWNNRNPQDKDRLIDRFLEDIGELEDE